MDFYILLGIERAATLNDIKRAYQRLARRYHPDINPGDRTAAAQFRQIAEAYETLSDPDRRRRYDSGGSGPVARRSDVRVRGLRLLGQRQRRVGADLRRSVRRRAAGNARADDRAASAAPICIRRSRCRFEDGDARRTSARSTVTRHEHCRACHGHRPAAGARRARCLHCHGSGVGEVGARAHGVLEAVRAVRRHRPAGGGALSGLRRRAGRDAHRDARRSRCPPGCRDGARIRVPARATRGGTAASPATST